MKRLSKILLSICSTMVLAGCGHTMYHKVEGTGLYGRIPTPNGGSLVEVAIGDMSITSGILRGGATLDENTSKVELLDQYLLLNILTYQRFLQ